MERRSQRSGGHPVSTVNISGRVYKERPSGRDGNGGRSRRLKEICEALAFASERCSELERSLYKSILEVRAQAENLAALSMSEDQAQGSLSDLRKHDAEP